MRNSFIVAWFTIKDTVRKKSFVVSNIIILSLILIIFSIIDMLFGNYSLQPENNTTTNETQISSENQTVENTIATTDVEEEINEDELFHILLVDSQKLLGNTVYTLKDNKVKFVISNEIENEQIYKKINSDEIYSAVKVYKQDDELKFDYIVSNIDSDTEVAAKHITDLLNKCYIGNILSQYGISDENISEIQKEFSYNIVSPKGITDFETSYLIGMLVSFILFFSIYLYGHSISASIASEKNSRIMETLVTSASPTHIILGKTLGMGILGLLQMLCIAIVTVFSYKTFISPGIDIISIYLPDVRLDAFSIFILFLYFILGYVIYAFLNAITGASVSKSDDIQNANLPLSFISMFAFYLSFFTFSSPDSKLSRIASIFPLSSPFSMPSKVLAGFSNNYDILSSVIVLLITTIILAVISIRIYSMAILHYGNRLTFKDLMKMLFRVK